MNLKASVKGGPKIPMIEQYPNQHYHGKPRSRGEALKSIVQEESPLMQSWNIHNENDETFSKISIASLQYRKGDEIEWIGHITVGNKQKNEKLYYIHKMFPANPPMTTVSQNSLQECAEHYYTLYLLNTVVARYEFTEIRPGGSQGKLVSGWKVVQSNVDVKKDIDVTKKFDYNRHQIDFTE